MAGKPTPQEAFDKLVKYCTYQERCHNEVRTKLLSLGVYGNDLENIMARLIEHNFLNEERFAKLYAGSKFRQLHWGRIKIVQQLKFRGISSYCIQEALKEIGEEQYLKILRQEQEKRKKQLKPDRNQVYKIAQYMISRGFEPDLVWRELKIEE